MTIYQDIYRDLPSRVNRVWQKTMTPTTGDTEDLSVTAMLMAATTGLAMPFENLKEEGAANGNKWKNHPAFKTVEPTAYKAAVDKCTAFFGKTLSDCKGLKQATLMHCQKLSDIRAAAPQGHGDAALDLSRHNVRFAIRILRNALAHNNVFDLPCTGGDQIAKLTFFSKSGWGADAASAPGWFVLVIDVAQFKEFLHEWFALLAPADSMFAAAEAYAHDGTSPAPAKRAPRKKSK